MDLFLELKVGDKLNIALYNGEITSGKNEILSTQLMDLSGKHLYISAPIYKGKLFSLHTGQKIIVVFYRKKGIYQFNADVVSENDGNITTFTLAPRGDIEKIQRRNYYRLPTVTNVVLKTLQNDRSVEFQCITKDLSGGGMKVICSKELELGEKLTADVLLYENEVITIDAEVVRVIKDPVDNVYEIGIKFQKIDRINESKIFAFIFERQRLLRKKGLI